MTFRTKSIAIALVFLLTILTATELCARYLLGLGEPARTIHEAEIDYLFAPGDYQKRFGIHISFNAYTRSC